MPCHRPCLLHSLLHMRRTACASSHSQEHPCPPLVLSGLTVRVRADVHVDDGRGAGDRREEDRAAERHYALNVP